MTNAQPVSYQREIPDVLTHLAGAQPVMDAYGLERPLHHLIQLRASQINRCAYCVKMHTREAREDGETNERLDRIVVWDQVNDFTAKEKAALAWTEALTVLGSQADLAELRARLREHFSEKEISIITATVAMINLWNHIQISRH